LALSQGSEGTGASCIPDGEERIAGLCGGRAEIFLRRAAGQCEGREEREAGEKGREWAEPPAESPAKPMAKGACPLPRKAGPHRAAKVSIALAIRRQCDGVGPACHETRESTLLKGPEEAHPFMHAGAGRGRGNVLGAVEIDQLAPELLRCRKGKEQISQVEVSVKNASVMKLAQRLSHYRRRGT